MRKLIELTVHEARELKSEAGREKYRPNGGEFVGDPLVELFEECLDGITYCDEAIRRGYSWHTLDQIRTEFIAAALKVQTVYNYQLKETEQGLAASERYVIEGN